MPQDDKQESKFVEMMAPKRLPELSGLLGVSPARLKAAALLLKRLTGFTSLTPEFEVPEVFSGYEPSAWEALLTIEKLKILGWVEVGYPLARLFPDEPFAYQYMVINKGMSVRSGFAGGGVDFFSKERALWAAVGEAIERYAIFNYEPEWYCDATYAAVRSHAIDLATIAGVSPEKRAHIPQLQFNNNSMFRWVTGRSLVSRKKMLLPLQLIRLDWHHQKKEELGADRGEPLLRMPVSTGAATHTNSTEAMLGGTLELIERDAFMITWMNQLSPLQISLKSIQNEQIQKTLAQFAKFNLKVTLFHLPTDFSVHVVLATIEDPTGVGPALNVGASARVDLESAIEKALSEAYACRFFIRVGYPATPTERPRTNFERPEEIGREERLHYWADSAHRTQADFLFAGPAQEFCNFTRFNTAGKTPKAQLQVLIDEFAQKNLELIAVPLLGPAMEKELGFVALQMVAPKLQPLHLYEGLPYNWGERLKTVPPQCGFTPAERENPFPHPFP